MYTELVGTHRFNLTIDRELVDKFRLWFDTRGGVLVWENQEIGSGAAAEVFTPAKQENGEPTDKPHWRYGNPLMVHRESLRVNYFRCVTSYRGRLVKKYWGYDLSDASKSKAESLKDKLPAIAGETPVFYWSHTYEYGQSLATIEIGYEYKQRFDNEQVETD